MAIRFEAVTLDAKHGDVSAMLVFHDDRLAAVISCLGPLHAGYAGQWFVEATFDDRPPHRPFASLDEASDWFDQAA